jgi:hypothetical protein
MDAAFEVESEIDPLLAQDAIKRSSLGVDERGQDIDQCA